MNKGLLVSAAVAVAISGSAFATGKSAHSARASETSDSMQFTLQDCQMLSVESARSACMQSAGGSSQDAVGASDSRAGSGVVGGGSGKHTKNRNKHRSSKNSKSSRGTSSNH